MDAELFGRKYLTAAALERYAPVKVKLARVVVEEIQNTAEKTSEQKLVVYFSEPPELSSLGLILNATNRKLLIELLGRETEQWIGKEIVLQLVPTMYRGTPTRGILVARA